MISVILPTCHRPQMLREMLTSLRKTTAEHDIEIYAFVDEDVESSLIAYNEFGCITDFSGDRRNVLSLWNNGLRACHGDFIHPAMDDLLYYDGWLDYALESHESKLNGCGVVGFNDLAYDGNLQVATQFMFDRKYCKEYMGGVIFSPVYNYLCVDIEINEKAKMVGKFYWDKRAIVEHRHSAHGKRMYDNHDTLKDKSNWVVLDGKILEERKAQGFPVTWKPMI